MEITELTTLQQLAILTQVNKKNEQIIWDYVDAYKNEPTSTELYMIGLGELEEMLPDMNEEEIETILIKYILERFPKFEVE